MLQLRIIRAQGVRAADNEGTSDPYCEAHIWSPHAKASSHFWRTATRVKTLDPIWNEQQEFLLFRREALLHVTLWDRDQSGRDDFLGETLLELSRLESGSCSAQLELRQLGEEGERLPISGHVELELAIETR